MILRLPTYLLLGSLTGCPAGSGSAPTAPPSTTLQPASAETGASKEIAMPNRHQVPGQAAAGSELPSQVVLNSRLQPSVTLGDSSLTLLNVAMVRREGAGTRSLQRVVNLRLRSGATESLLRLRAGERQFASGMAFQLLDAGDGEPAPGAESESFATVAVARAP